VKKLLMIAVVALCLTGLVGIGASGGGANAAEAGSAKATPIKLEMVPGQIRTGTGTLYALKEWQVFVVINTSASTGNLKAVIEDCCIMGDTMIALMLGSGISPQFDWGASPGAIQVGPVPMRPGWALIVTGYVQCPGGFPAGYYWDILL